MLYFGGGYPALDFPVTVALVPPPPLDLTELAIEIPMFVRTGDTTRPVAFQVAITLPMRMALTVEVPMTRGIANQVSVMMRAMTRSTMENP
jgi:hypothetical protein